jgi:hypothetical protein
MKFQMKMEYPLVSVINAAGSIQKLKKRKGERKMNDLEELHIKGELATKGFLKESWDEESSDLKHELTKLGKIEVLELLKDPIHRKELIKMAIEESKKYPPEIRADFLKSIANKVKSFGEEYGKF